MKKKYIDCSGYSWAKAYENYYEAKHDHYSITRFQSVDGDIPVDYDADEILFKDGSTVLAHLTDDYCLSVVKQEGRTVEWYFDMIEHRGFDCKPYFYDLYLDVVVNPEGKVITLDEDELLQAYDDKVINNHHIKQAYQQAEHVRDQVVTNQNYMHAEVNDMHDSHLRTMDIYKHFLKEHGPFDVPMFYLREGLRFELSDNSVMEDKINRAYALYESFLSSDEIYVVVNSYEDKHGFVEYIHAQAGYKRKLCQPTKNGYIYQYLYHLNTSDIEVKNILKCVIHKDFRIEPYTDDEIFICNEGNVFSIYDDCGLDIVGDFERMKLLYHKHHNWLLSYDLESMRRYEV